jgi:hypothetical protein
MIYLRYAYQKSGLPEPKKIGLQIHEPEFVQSDVLDEFQLAFPDAKVRMVSPADKGFDICILTFRKSAGAVEQIKWCWQRQKQARYGMGFFSIHERTLQIVPKRQLPAWTAQMLAFEASVSIIRLFANTGRSTGETE